MYRLSKRIFDIFFSLTGLVLLAPLLVCVALTVKFSSPGPVFYRGERTGRSGRPFRIYKFRSMVVDAERLGGTATAHNDFRITTVGRFIRRYKIDELPQLINVIKGEMSLVGPRPEVQEHTACYNDEEKIILTVPPGITDNSSLRFINLNELLGTEDPNRVFIEKYRSEKNRLRVDYVRNMSFWGDVKIIITTIFRVFRI